MLTIAVIGLGKLGYPIACSLGKFHTVIGIDKDESVIQAISDGGYLLEEGCSPTDLSFVTTDFSAAADADIVAIVTPTPSLADGKFDSSSVIDVIVSLQGHYRPTQLIVVCSTVMPGECDGPIREALDSVSHGISLAYSPEFVALGSVVENFLNPDFVLVGTNEDPWAEYLIDIMYDFTDAPKMHVTRVEAEIAKISLNTFITMKISYANSIARVCEQFTGADAKNVCEVLGKDSRIGSKYFTPSTSYGGPCFVRDTKAFSLLGAGELADAADKINDQQLDWIISKIKGEDRIGILGLTYKQNTYCTEESIGSRLFAWCQDNGVEATCFDEMLGGDDSAFTEKVVVVCTPHESFKHLHANKGQIFIDLWDICNGDRIVPGRK